MPSAFVRVVTLMPVATLVTTTAASASTAPPLSLTTPVTVAISCCAAAFPAPGTTRHSQAHTSTQPAFAHTHPFLSEQGPVGRPVPRRVCASCKEKATRNGGRAGPRSGSGYLAAGLTGVAVNSPVTLNSSTVTAPASWPSVPSDPL